MAERKTVDIAVPGVGGIVCPVRVRPALRCGVWAVTPWIGMDDKIVRGRWRVTHVPTGRGANRAWSDKRDAIRLCRMLARRLPGFGANRRFGEQPRSTTGPRWRLARATVHEWMETRRG